MSRPKYAIVLRTYGGTEAARVKRGSIITIDAKTPEPGRINVTWARYTQLRDARLVKEWAPGDPPPSPQDLRRPLAKVEDDSVPQALTGEAIRRASRARSPESQTDSPAEPRKIQGPRGGQTGKDEPPLSSREGPQPKNKISGLRGKRVADSSPSTTHGDSVPGQTSSTPAMQTGGDSTSKASPPSSEEVL